MPQHPWKQQCTWNDSDLHSILHVQVIRSQLRLHCSIRTFHSSNFLVSSNTRLCQSRRCFVSSSLYSPSNLDDAGLPIRLDLDTFIRTQESKHHLHAVLISFRTHFCRGQIAIVLQITRTVAFALGSSTNVPSAPTNMKSIWFLTTSPSIGCGASR